MSGGGHLKASSYSVFRLCKQFFAFTLAEVLVTLGIIGVVSALTVPTLMQNYQKKSYVTQLHKVYNEILQASMNLQTDKNAVNLRETGLGSVDGSVNFIKNYFKVIQDCGNDPSPCFASGNYKKIDGTKYLNYDNSASKSHHYFVLASGAAIVIYPHTDISDNIVVEIGTDINGKQGPNIVGRDVFGMYLYNNGVIDDYSVDVDAGREYIDPPLSEEVREKNFQSACNSSQSTWGHGCFGKILNDNWEMTY